MWKCFDTKIFKQFCKKETKIKVNGKYNTKHCTNFFQTSFRKNLEELTHIFSETIDWYIPGDKTKAPWLGTRSNRNEIREFYELLWENTEPISATIDKILIENDTAIISGEFSSKMTQTNKVVDSLFFIQLTVKDN
ncbi:ketosteroid isomerase-like protein [Pedobacter sp. UYP30]|uniref:nuclear transport factor 2 family protein n=1 Tax=Pedobacter sp. UYP30 TaxID=1756400 RepID=UPI003394AB3D